MKFDLNNPRTLATTGVMTALVLGMTMVRIAVTPVNGYVHLGDIGIYFTAFAFGPWAGLVAGGVGTALADVISGYAVFAPLSLAVHGLQGLVAGWIVHDRPAPARLALAVLAGGLVVVVGYFAGESLIPVFGGLGAATGEVPFNVMQEVFGALGAVVYMAVARAYPRLWQARQS
ncbi:MAG: ECF transporter S component [Anaerolineae bacterium]|nr:ECF transporter S component [Anaerolineae bacterium]